VLPSGFGSLDCHLPPQDGFLLLMEPLNLLQDSEQFLLLKGFVYRGFLFPVLQLNLLKLDVSLVDLYR
jgi:hypothetical protein